ncbi:MAG: hypothetical protein JWQ79_784 [Mucilaginibacter sp.]|jgi:hypothetical protein|nr:hypothetical protein [Mucilaginibacter sp.]
MAKIYFEGGSCYRKEQQPEYEKSYKTEKAS